MRWLSSSPAILAWGPGGRKVGGGAPGGTPALQWDQVSLKAPTVIRGRLWQACGCSDPHQEQGRAWAAARQRSREGVNTDLSQRAVTAVWRRTMPSGGRGTGARGVVVHAPPPPSSSHHTSRGGSWDSCKLSRLVF